MNDTNKTILLVEDEAIISMTEKNQLKSYGYNVITVDSGEKSIETFKNTPGIDLILMDIDLGNGIDGTEAATLLLEIEDIPIVFLSSHTEPDIVGKTEKITSYGYVEKCSSITVLVASIKMAFKLFYANKIIAESVEKYRAIVDNTNDYIMRFDTESRHKFGNPAALTAAGVTIDQYIGKSYRDLGYPEQLCNLWENAINKVFKTGVSQSIEFDVDLADGKKSLQLLLSPEFDSRVCRVKSVIGIARDITVLKRTEEDLRTHQVELQMQNDEFHNKHKELEALRAKYFDLYDMAPVGYCIVTKNGLINEANITLAQILGTDRSALINQPFSSFIIKEDQDFFYQHRNRLFETEEGQTCELRMWKKNKSVFTSYLKSVIKKDVEGFSTCSIAVIEKCETQ